MVGGKPVTDVNAIIMREANIEFMYTETLVCLGINFKDTGSDFLVFLLSCYLGTMQEFVIRTAVNS